jgi:hypothetical protein
MSEVPALTHGDGVQWPRPLEAIGMILRRSTSSGKVVSAREFEAQRNQVAARMSMQSRCLVLTSGRFVPVRRIDRRSFRAGRRPCERRMNDPAVADTLGPFSLSDRGRVASQVVLVDEARVSSHPHVRSGAIRVSQTRSRSRRQKWS